MQRRGRSGLLAGGIQAILQALVLAMLLGPGLGVLWADQGPAYRLVLEVADEALSPSETLSFRRRVEQLVALNSDGVSPFDGRAEVRLIVRVSRGAEGLLVAQTSLSVDGAGTGYLNRNRTWYRLADNVAESASSLIWRHELRKSFSLPPKPDSGPDPGEPGPEAPRAASTDASPPLARPGPAQPQPQPQPQPRSKARPRPRKALPRPGEWFVPPFGWVGAQGHLALLGVPGMVSGGVRVEAGLWMTHWLTLGLEARWDPEVWSEVGGREVGVWRAEGALAPCVRAGGAMGCGLLAVGWLSVAGSGPEGQTAGQVYGAGGVRLALERGFGRFGVRVQADLLAPFARPEFQHAVMAGPMEHRETLWQPPEVMVTLGLAALMYWKVR